MQKALDKLPLKQAQPMMYPIIGINPVCRRQRMRKNNVLESTAVVDVFDTIASVVVIVNYTSTLTKVSASRRKVRPRCRR